VLLKKYAPVLWRRRSVRHQRRDSRRAIRLSFHPGERGAEFRLTGLGAALSDLRIRQREEKEEFLKIPDLALKDAEVDPGRKEIGIGEVVTARGTVAVRRSAGGETNVARLVPEERHHEENRRNERSRGDTIQGGRAGRAAVESCHKESDRRPVRRAVRGPHHGPPGGDRPRPAPAWRGRLKWGLLAQAVVVLSILTGIIQLWKVRQQGQLTSQN